MPHAAATAKKNSTPTSTNYFFQKTTTPKVAAAVAASRQDFDTIDALIAHNVRRTQQALSSESVRLGAHHFAGSTGYGRGDSGRAALDAAVAALVGTETAVARPHFVSGTHAIAAALFGVLRPGDELLAVAGKPYDTLDPVIGIEDDASSSEEDDDNDQRRSSSSSASSSSSSASSLGSLKDWGVSFRALPLDPSTSSIAWEALEGNNSSSSSVVRPTTRVALIQRSCGYSSERGTLTLAEISRAALALKNAASKIGNTRLVVAVDNCYGEFTEENEPGSIEGVDIVMGSFIKGFGGTVAPCGGYIAGKKELVEAAAARATAPGVGLDYGAIEGGTLRLLFQGLWLVREEEEFDFFFAFSKGREMATRNSLFLSYSCLFKTKKTLIGSPCRRRGDEGRQARRASYGIRGLRPRN